MVAVLQEFITILVGGLQSIGTAIGGALSNMAEKMFLVSTTTDGVTTYTLSVFGGVLAIFAGISLAVGKLVHMPTINRAKSVKTFACCM